MKDRYLILENGKIFAGKAFGADSASTGELVFSTSVCGYLETLTDPVYYGQIVMQTFPLIGNYGIIEEDLKGGCFVKGYVVRELCDTPSNFRSQYTLDEYLQKAGVAGIYGVDTREITKMIRKSGTMNACICDTIPNDISFIKSYNIKDAVMNVTKPETVVYQAVADKKYRVALIDNGSKSELIAPLRERGCEVTSLPYTTSAEEILNGSFDGVVVSDGPGDPADNENIVCELSKLVGNLAVFGVGLGHQLVCLALGGKTAKHKQGHRGSNQPVKDVNGKRTYITTQNHGYVVLPETLNCGKMSYVNINDGSCEGIDYPDKKAFTVQFIPEISDGPNDMSFLYDRFCLMMGGELCASR